MMLLTIFSIVGMDTWSGSAVFGYSVLAGFSIAVALSAQRWLLWYLLGGMAYWLLVEVIHNLLLNWIVLSEWHSYVAAMGISWLPLFGWILYRALHYDHVSPTMKEECALRTARYIEHSPVYDDDYKPRFH